MNKSYRGRCSPLLIHSTEGAGRAGVYCAVDVICQRIQRGVKVTILALFNALGISYSGLTLFICRNDLFKNSNFLQEIDVSASLEHLRDQRPCLVKTADQYKFIYACVAQEVSALLKVYGSTTGPVAN